MRGVGKMLSLAGADASLSFAGDGAFPAAADRAEPLAVAVCAGMSSVAFRGRTFLVAGGSEDLALAVCGGTPAGGGEASFVGEDGEPVAATDGGEAGMTGGGSIGTSGGGEPLAVARGAETPGPAGLLHHMLRPPQ
jgi:hypothetical protein